MDRSALERALLATPARPLLVDARLVRRVIKRHRRLGGAGLQVPHAHCYVLPRAALLAIVDERELGHAAADLPEDVILLPRPDRDDLAQTPADELLRHLWRYAFHSLVHLEIERRAAEGKLTPARLRERENRIGQTELDEIRLVLRQDDLLLAQHDELSLYAEFAALYLELRHFAPELLGEMFPTFHGFGNADAALAEDVDAERLLEACRPEGAAPAARPARTSLVTTREDSAPFAPAPVDAPPASLRGEADDARRRGNAVRSSITRLRLSTVEGPDEGEARSDLGTLARRLGAALHEDDFDTAAWTTVLFALARKATSRASLRRVEARLLYDLQSACLAAEKDIGKVDLVDWVLSLGRRPIARLLPATRPIRVAHALADAAKKLPRVDLPEAQRARLGELLAAARARADENTRAALRPTVEEILRDVGLRAESVPEEVALAKVVEELLDQATAHGFLGLGLVRDALSRNQLKLPDLTGPRELFGGDALLRADRRLGLALDGVHRRGEIYLRALQKMTSLLFGTKVGRVLTLYFLLPFGAAYVLMMGTGLVVHELTEHVVNPISRALGGSGLHHLHLAKPEARPDIFLIVTALIFGLLHSARVRHTAHTALRAVGFLLASLFVHLPAWVLSRPLVRGLLASRAYLAFRRYVFKPAALAAALVYVTPLRHRPDAVRLPAALALFLALNVLLNTGAGALVEELALDALTRGWRRLRRHVLPGLFRLIVDFFRWLGDSIERGIYTVDEWLRFREGQSRVVLGGKAVAGLVWFAFAYFFRTHFNLLVEPTFNPIKHVPTVTVAAKLMLAVDQQLISGFNAALMPVLGNPVAPALAASTVALIPGFFGFLVWELKENYKLYRATRPAVLRPVPIGHHGETMGALVKPGFHSGTLPKLWAKLRRAARKGDGAVEKHKETLREVEEAVERFAARELTALLATSPAWKGGPVHVSRVALASNRVRIELGRRGGGGEGEGREGGGGRSIVFEEQSGWLVAGVSRAGWLSALGESDRVLFENALGGLYQRAGVDLVREQIEAALPGAPPYDVADEGLVVWPGGGYATELVYDLHAPGKLTAKVRGEATAGEAPELERSRVLFREQAITWTAWVAAWKTETPHRVVTGGSLLPARD